MNKRTIAQFRLTHRLSQKDLAELLGVSSPSVSAYETGRVPILGRVKSKMTRLIEEHGIDYDLKLPDEGQLRIKKNHFEKAKEEAIIDLKTVVEGVSPDAPIVYNEQGGGQSHSPYRMDLIDPLAILEVGKALAEGAEKYGENNWKLIPIEDHLNHLLVHIYAYLAGDKSDNHLSHAICRAIFALGVEKERKK